MELCLYIPYYLLISTVFYSYHYQPGSIGNKASQSHSRPINLSINVILCVLLNRVTLDEMVEPIQELCVLHHVGHDVLTLVV